MTSDVSLVTHTAKRNAYVLALHGTCDRGSDRGLTHTGRADKTNDLVLQIGGKLLDSQKFQNALLDLVKTVVVCVQNLFGSGNVHAVLGGFIPRQGKANVQIILQHSRLGRAEGRTGKAVVFLVQLFLHLFGQMCACDAHLVFVNLVVALAKLLLQRADLLTHVVFLLVSCNALAHTRVDHGVAF